MESKTKSISLSQVQFAYEPNLPLVVQDVSLEIAAGSFTVVVGPSGGGKSTLLRLIAGLDHPQKGVIENPFRTRMIFQGGALLPWQTVLENVYIGFTGMDLRDGEKRSRALSVLKELGIDALADSFPRHLSGGQRQRVGIARAIASSPEVLLLDEPFSALDVETTERLSDEVLRIWQDQQMTLIMVSHSIEDAVLLADRVLVYRDAHVAESVPVNLPRPRKRDDPAVRELVHKIQKLIPSAD